MRARTEDLLTIRDGEPIDAELRERLLADDENLREVQRLAQLAENLRQLPDIPPPAGGWERIAAATVATSRGAHRSTTYWAGAAAAAVVLAVAAAALSGAWRAKSTGFETADVRPDVAPSIPVEREPDIELEGAVSAEAETRVDPEANAVARAETPESPDVATSVATSIDTSVDYDGLVAESLRLEMLLAELAPSPRLMNAGTARTIADLEDHIVLVDEQLMYAEARDADPRYRQALWSERVDVMNALLHVRYAQAQAPRY